MPTNKKEQINEIKKLWSQMKPEARRKLEKAIRGLPDHPQAHAQRE